VDGHRLTVSHRTHATHDAERAMNAP